MVLLTVGFFLIYFVIRWCCENWSSEDRCRRHWAQLIGTLFILKMLYELGRLWKYSFLLGEKWVYQATPLPDPTVLSPPTPYPEKYRYAGMFLLLTPTTLGLYLPYRFIELICLHFSSPIWWRRQVAQTLGLFIVGKILWELLVLWGTGLQMGVKWVYAYPPQEKEEGQPLKHYPTKYRAYGMGLLTLCTFGGYLPYRFLELIFLHFSSPIWWRRQVAQTLGLFIVGKIWWELFRQGREWTFRTQPDPQPDGTVKQKPYSLTLQLMGHLLLGIALTPLFLVIKLFYDLWKYGLEWRYGEPEEHTTYPPSRRMLGAFLLIWGSLGLYLLWMVGEAGYYGTEWIIDHWKSDVFWKRHLSQTIGLVIILKIWWELFRHGRKWVYYRPIPLPSLKDQNGTSPLEPTSYQVTSPVHKALSFKSSPQSPSSEPDLDQMATPYSATPKVNPLPRYSKCQIFWGHIFLTLTCTPLFLVFRLVQLIIQNWSSPTPWKKHLAQTLGSLLIGKLIYELWHYGLKWRYHQKKTSYQILGFLCLTLGSFGLYLIWAFGELWVVTFFLGKIWYYKNNHRGLQLLGFLLLLPTTLGLILLYELGRLLKEMHQGYQSPPETPNRKKAETLTYVFTLGAGTLFLGRRSTTRWKRYLSTIILSFFSVVFWGTGLYFLWAFDLLPQWAFGLVALTAFFLLYPVNLFLKSQIWYRESVRHRAFRFWERCVMFGWQISHRLDQARHRMHRGKIAMQNSFSRSRANFRTWRSATYARFRNVTRRQMSLNPQPPLTPGDAGYYEPRTYQPTVYEVRPEPDWHAKMNQRLYGEETREKQIRLGIRTAIRMARGERAVAWSAAHRKYPQFGESFWEQRYRRPDDRHIFNDDQHTLTVSQLAQALVQHYQKKDTVPMPNLIGLTDSSEHVRDYQKVVQSYSEMRKDLRRLEKLTTKKNTLAMTQNQWAQRLGPYLPSELSV